MTRVGEIGLLLYTHLYNIIIPVHDGERKRRENENETPIQLLYSLPPHPVGGQDIPSGRNIPYVESQLHVPCYDFNNLATIIFYARTSRDNDHELHTTVHTKA